MITGSTKKNYLKDCSQKYPDVSMKKVQSLGSFSFRQYVIDVACASAT